MQIAQRLAGYSLGGADLLRRAMGKKKPEEMAKQKATFVDGAINERRDRRRRRAHLRAARVLRRLRLQQEPLGRVRAAHLPDRVPEGALPGRVPLRAHDGRPRQDREGRAHHRRGARDGASTVLPPDINESQTDFTVVYAHRRTATTSRRAAQNGARTRCRPQIRFGLGAVRGSAKRRSRPCSRRATAGGPFDDLFDFAARVDAQARQQGRPRGARPVRRVRPTLTPRGVTRARAFAAVDRALERSRSASRDRESGQTTLFSLLENRAGGDVAPREDRVPRARAVGSCARRSVARSRRSASTSRATRSIATARSCAAST